jgi:thioredoxin 1
MSKINSVVLGTLLIVSLFTGCKHGKNNESKGDVVVLTSENFEAETTKGIVLIDFWASWCMPCRAMSPVIEEIAAQTKGKLKVGKVDVDANGDLANRFRVQGIPNIIILKDGKEVENLVGLRSKEALVQVLGKYIPLGE